MKTNQVMIRPMGQFKVEQRTKDGFFCATELLRQWNETLDTNFTIEEFVNSYVPTAVKSRIVDNRNGEVYLPLALEPQLRLYVANYDLDLYDKINPTITVNG